MHMRTAGVTELWKLTTALVPTVNATTSQNGLMTAEQYTLLHDLDSQLKALGV